MARRAPWLGPARQATRRAAPARRPATRPRCARAGRAASGLLRVGKFFSTSCTLPSSSVRSGRCCRPRRSASGVLLVCTKLLSSKTTRAPGSAAARAACPASRQPLPAARGSTSSRQRRRRTAIAQAVQRVGVDRGQVHLARRQRLVRAPGQGLGVQVGGQPVRGIARAVRCPPAGAAGHLQHAAAGEGRRPARPPSRAGRSGARA
jgi:hypothetical protein